MRYVGWLCVLVVVGLGVLHYGDVRKEAPQEPDSRESAAPETSEAVDVDTRGTRPDATYALPPAGAPGTPWRWSVSEVIEPSAALYAGDGWNDEARDDLLAALARLRVAAVRVERASDDPESPAAIRAYRKHREATLRADAVSRRLFGMPLASFLVRVEGSEIEDVPAG